MHRFWSPVIEPLFELTQPKKVVEIGSDYGTNTRQLLEYSRTSGAICHIVDPAPRYDVAGWKAEFGVHAVFHLETSLGALPKIGHSDIVLVDGDHNWYTVINELRTLASLASAESAEFPIVLLHDIGWPYGRRDLYYKPESIPPEFRKPYDRRGIRRGSSELAPEGGFNAHLFNATTEDNVRNGVATAIEDFLKETSLDLGYREQPLLHGLGVIAPKKLEESVKGLRDFLDQLEPKGRYRDLAIAAESSRLDTLVELHEGWAQLKRAKSDLAESQAKAGRRSPVIPT